MLSAKEFTVGTLGDAKPLSLMLPRTEYEAAILIGEIEDGPAAVFLSGEYIFRFFGCSNSTNWRGLLIPNVRIEINEASLFDPQSVTANLGTLIRIDTGLTICAQADRSFGGHSRVILESDLPPTHGLSAGFSKWHIVVGEGQDKRVLWAIDTDQKLPPRV